MWEDKTIDYYSAIRFESIATEVVVKCASLGNAVDIVKLVHCWGIGYYEHFGTQWSVCQTHVTRRGRHAQHTSMATQQLPAATRHTWPSLALVNTTTASEGLQWRLVTCPSGHVTHTFLACDVSAFCWAGSSITFSLLPELWALPTSQSCKAHVALTSLPPSFPCESDVWRVPYTLVCDHRQDCVDGSDEAFCTFPPCQWQSQHQCANKQVCRVPPCLCFNQFIHSPNDENDQDFFASILRRDLTVTIKAA